MHLIISDLLPWLNLLLVPAVTMLIKLENRITKLETTLQFFQHHIEAQS